MIKLIFTNLLIGSYFYLSFITHQCYATDAKKEATVRRIKADHILVQKSKRKLLLIHRGKVLRSYTVSLGFSPQGPKQKEGDGKTPEGKYRICAKNPNSQFHRSLKISYPNSQDQKRAKENKVSPGDHIMIHGLGRNFSWLGSAHTRKDWTLGCIAVTDAEIEEIWALVDNNTSIAIEP